MHVHRGGRPCRPHCRSPLRFDTDEQLREHRELEYLRTAALPRGAKGRSRRLKVRGRKLDATLTLIADTEGGAR